MVRIEKQQALISETISTAVNGVPISSPDAMKDSDTSADEVESDHKGQKEISRPSSLRPSISRSPSAAASIVPILFYRYDDVNTHIILC